MLHRLISGLAIASIFVGLIVLVFWWRSYRHVDHITFGKVETTQTTFTTRDGGVMITTRQNMGGMINSQSVRYPIWRAATGCLAIPAFWLAVAVRKKLPRPGGLTAEELRRRARDGAI